MKKMLIFVSRINNFLISDREKKVLQFFDYVKILSKVYKIDLVYFQSLDNEANVLSEFKKYVENVCDFRDIKVNSKEYKIEDKYKILSKNNYDAIFYTSFYLLKNSLPYVIEYMKNSVLILNLINSENLFKYKMFLSNSNTFNKNSLKYEIENNEINELLIYNYLDLILVSEEIYKNFLESRLNNVRIEFLNKDFDEKKVVDLFLNCNKKSVIEENDFDIIVLSTKNNRKKNIVINYDSSKINYREIDENVSVVKNYNLCLKSLKNKYLLIIPSDAILINECVEQLLFVIRNYKDSGIIFAANNKDINIFKHYGPNFDPYNNLIDFWNKHYIANFGFCENSKFVLDKSFLIKRNVLEQVGLLDEQYNTIECAVMDLCLKVYQYGLKVVKTYESIIYYQNVEIDKNYDKELSLDLRKLLKKWTFDTTKFLFSLK